MSLQPDLFNPALTASAPVGRSSTRLQSREAVPDFPRARVSDPISSHHAAADIERSGVAAHQSRQALAACRLWPNSTSMELAEVSKLDRYALARRLPELAKQGLVEKIEPTDDSVPCVISHKRVVRWRPA